jgi:hypothetical protein
MKALKIRDILLLTILLSISFDCTLFAMTPDDSLSVRWREVNAFFDDNEKCLVCHGESYYTLTDPVAGVSKIRNMFQDYYVSRESFYSSVHKSFSCTDCHSPEFTSFPHQVTARLEEHYACIDCHGYDENYAHLNFEEIEVEYNNSTHAGVSDFSCWKCHDPHSYRLIARETTDISELVLYDNNMCLECHANFNKFRLLSKHEEINVVNRHEWLPNQVLHFQSVRCIECHTEVSDSILIAHTVLPKEKAVRNCTECHSTDSRLMSTLYKFESQEKRRNGFFNSIILNRSYVIGASRNIYLGYLSFVIFFGLLSVIGIHIFFRVIKAKKK